jgi:hypothetical protein
MPLILHDADKKWIASDNYRSLAAELAPEAGVLSKRMIYLALRSSAVLPEGVIQSINLRIKLSLKGKNTTIRFRLIMHVIFWRNCLYNIHLRCLAAFSASP